MQDTIETPVLFRIDRLGKDRQVTAVFPTIPHDYAAVLMTCYAHVGQHGGCSLSWYYTTRPATPAQYADLKRELESPPYGYKLKVLQRITKRERAAFREAMCNT